MKHFLFLICSALFVSMRLILSISIDMVEEAPITLSPFSSANCTLFSNFYFNDFVTIVFPDLAEDLDIQIQIFDMTSYSYTQYLLTILPLIILLSPYLPLIAVIGSFLLSLTIVLLTRKGHLGLVYNPPLYLSLP